MSLDYFKEIISPIEREIDLLIEKTEEIYGTIYLQLPAIEKEIDYTLKEMNILLEYFIPSEEQLYLNSTGETNKETLKLAGILLEIEKSFSATAANLAQKVRLQSTITNFLEGDTNGSTGIDSLLQMIEGIKTKLTDIEIVSLNAIIYAARLGEAGRPFAVISNHINTLSTDVNVQYAGVLGYAADLLDWNSRFKHNLQNLLHYNNKLAVEQREQFQHLFHATFSALGEIGRLLRGLNDNVRKAVGPVEELMVSIQAQDILRQNMENVIKCLSAITEGIGMDRAGDRENKDPGTLHSSKRLELLTYIYSVAELTLNLVDNIEQGLLDSFAELKYPIQNMCSTLGELNEEGTLLSEFLGGGPSGEAGNGSVKEIFFELDSFIQSFGSGLNNLQQEIEGFASSTPQFYKLMSIIENRIGFIKRRTGFLQKLQLLSRIELSRLKIENSSFGEEISRISDRVTDSVDQSESFIMEIKKSLQRELYHFEQVLASNRESIGSMLQVIELSRDQLADMEKLVSRAVQELGQCCHNLDGATASIAAHLQSGEVLFHYLQRIKVSLVELKQEAFRQKEEALEAAGLNHWESSGAKLQELLSSLTTYLERCTASGVFDTVDLDVGSEEGELVLFE